MTTHKQQIEQHNFFCSYTIVHNCCHIVVPESQAGVMVGLHQSCKEVLQAMAAMLRPIPEVMSHRVHWPLASVCVCVYVCVYVPCRQLSVCLWWRGFWGLLQTACTPTWSVCVWLLCVVIETHTAPLTHTEHTHTHTHARTHTRTHARTHTRTHARTHTHPGPSSTVSRALSSNPAL